MCSIFRNFLSPSVSLNRLISRKHRLTAADAWGVPDRERRTMSAARVRICKKGPVMRISPFTGPDYFLKATPHNESCGALREFCALTSFRFHGNTSSITAKPRLVSTQNLLANRSCSIVRYCLKYRARAGAAERRRPDERAFLRSPRGAVPRGAAAQDARPPRASMVYGAAQADGRPRPECRRAHP